MADVEVLQLSQVPTLNPQHLLDFLRRIVDKCTLEQWAYLEQNVQSLFRIDFLELPDVVANKILDYLDFEAIIKLTLVCRSWRDKVRCHSPFWKKLCEREWGSADVSCLNSSQPSCLWFYRLYRFLRSTSRALGAGKALRQETHTVSLDSESQSQSEICDLRNFVPCHVAYENDSLVVGVRRRKLLLLDTEALTRRWEVAGATVCSLHMSHQTIIWGAHWGQLTVLDHQGFQVCDQLQFPSSPVALDVDPSGQYTLVGLRDGEVRLLDSEYNIHLVQIKKPLPHPDREESSIPDDFTPKKVFFLPRSAGLYEDLLVVCVCCKVAVTVAVVDREGKVVWETFISHHSDMVSFCRCDSNANVIYASWHNHLRSNVVKFVMDYPTFHSTDLTFDHTHRGNLLLLAAGKRFMIVLKCTGIVIIDLKDSRQIGYYDHFTDMFSVDRLLHSDGMAAVKVLNKEWLNGLSPTALSSKRPVVIFAQTHPVSNMLCITSLHWSLQPFLDMFLA